MSCMMSDMQSVDSGPKEDFDFNDFDQEDQPKKKRSDEILVKSITRTTSKLPSIRLTSRGRKLDSGPLDTLPEQPE